MFVFFFISVHTGHHYEPSVVQYGDYSDYAYDGHHYDGHHYDGQHYDGQHYDGQHYSHY